MYATALCISVHALVCSCVCIRLKCTVIVRIFSFLTILLNLHHSALDQVAVHFALASSNSKSFEYERMCCGDRCQFQPLNINYYRMHTDSCCDKVGWVTRRASECPCADGDDLNAAR